MKLASGTRLGAYRITGFVASGGMGGVYEAVHTELRRRVAIKVLGEEISGDPAALRRFRREAKSASQLNHPHICTVHDFGQANGTAYLVLEFLEGETLAQRLERGRYTVRDTLRHGAQIAEALHHAHEHGFVHRDLKPGNVMLTPTGAKVLDFGLVKRSAGRSMVEETADGTSVSSLTRQGTIVGTLPYMAPEQVEGGAADARTDIYGLGAVLFEMVTGEPPARGRTTAALIADILQGDHVSDLEAEPDVSEALAHVIRRCLRKDPDERWQDARDVAIELRWISRAASEAEPAPESEPRARARRRLAWIGGIAAAALFGLALLVPLGPDGSSPADAPALRFGISPPPGVTFTEGARNVPAVSPDGERIAFVGTDDEGISSIWIHSLSDGRTTRLPGEMGALNPFWAPDGRAVGFFSGRGLEIVHLPGGPVETLATVAFESGGTGGGAWSASGNEQVILFAPGLRSGLFRVSPDGGGVERVTTVAGGRGERGHLWPHFLPDGERFLYFVDSLADSVRGIYMGTLDDPRGRRVARATASGAYANGHLLYVRHGTLLAQTFDPRRGVQGGSPSRLADSVATTYAAQAAFSVSGTGVLAYWSQVSRDLKRLVWLDRRGGTIEVVSSPGHFRNPALSGDGRYVAVDVFDGADRDLLVIELEDGRERRLTDLASRVRDPVWAPDSRRLAYAAEETDGWVLEWIDVHSARPPVTILGERSDKFPIDWSPDGRLVTYVEQREEMGWDVLATGLDRGSKEMEPLPLAASAHVETGGRFSPSGARIAYESNLAEHVEIYVEPFPATGLRCQISSGGGFDPHWGADDSRLYYLSPGGFLMSVDLHLDGRCEIAAPQPLFETEIETPYTARNHYEVSPDGERFLFNLPAGDPRTQTVSVVVNWPAALGASSP